MKQIYVARDRVDADLACEAVCGRGFAAVVVGDLVAIPSAPFPSVWVPDSEVELARLAWVELRSLQEGMHR